MSEVSGVGGCVFLTQRLPTYLHLWHNIGSTFKMVKKPKIALNEPAIITVQSTTAYNNVF